MLKLLSEQFGFPLSESSNFRIGWSDPTLRYFLSNVDRTDPSVRVHDLHTVSLVSSHVFSQEVIALCTHSSHAIFWPPNPTTRKPSRSGIGYVD